MELKVTNTSHILYMFGLVWISYKIFLLSVVSIKIERKKQRNRRDALGLTFLFLLNASRSMHFGKSGGRCKSLQCGMMSWMCAAMEIAVFVFVFNSGGLSLFALIRSVCRRGKQTPPHHSLQERVRGLCPPAFSDPWLISGAPWQDNCEPKSLWGYKK